MAVVYLLKPPLSTWHPFYRLINILMTKYENAASAQMKNRVKYQLGFMLNLFNC